MRDGILLTLPKYDTVTEYLSAFSIEFEEFALKKSIFLKSLKDKEVNKLEFEKVLCKLDLCMVVFNGHGGQNCLFGDQNKLLIKVGQNEKILSGRIVYARSCEAAFYLGKKCVQDSDGCFIGYDLPFEFYFNPEWSTNPIKDNIARLFLDSSNLVPLSLMKGNSTLESHERSKKQMLKNIKKVLRSGAQESFSIAESLWNNYMGQKILGNEGAKIK